MHTYVYIETFIYKLKKLPQHKGYLQQANSQHYSE